jgi:GNAT superfamily N-acetyltransferase
MIRNMDKSMPKNRAAIAIRNATKKDLAAVEKWLRAEHEKTGEGFFCNWSVIAGAFKRKDLFVLAADGDIAGFVVDAVKGPDIVEVCPEKRGMGYGRRLAEWAITSAVDRGNSVIEGKCAPESSAPFWEKMGFTVSQMRRGFDGGLYAYKVLERSVVLSKGPRVPFEIAFYPRAFTEKTESRGSPAGTNRIQGSCWSGGQHGWRNRIRRICVGALLVRGKMALPSRKLRSNLE